MDGVESVRKYIDRLIVGDSRVTHGMKVLLLDASTTQTISSVYSQTEILQREIYLVSRIDDGKSNPNLRDDNDEDEDGELEAIPTSSAALQKKKNKNNKKNDSKSNNKQKQSHLKAICFLRPTEINAGLLVRELSRPRFSEYHLFFSCIVPSSLLRLLAESDIYEKVIQVQEFYADFLPISPTLLSLNCRHTLAMTTSAGTTWARDHLPLYQRNRDGLNSILLALKRQPSLIRFSKSSIAAKQLALDVHESISQDDIFHFPQNRRNNGKNLLLLILDRKDDPITPLLSQWTYQAMVHELLGINNHRVILRDAPGISRDLHEVVLNAAQDDFFEQNQHSNFGELGEAVKILLEDYQRHQNTSQNLNSIEDMQNFMEKFPEIKAKSHTVSKHVAIMGELARLVDVCALMDVSQFEQELACQEDHNTQWRELVQKLQSVKIKIPDKLRLGLLYALRYENTGNIPKIKEYMRQGGVPDDMVLLLDILLRYAGTKARGGGGNGAANGGAGSGSDSGGQDLFGNRDVFTKITKNFMTSVQGVANVYSQHVPLLMGTINLITKGKLRESTHPTIVKSNMNMGMSMSSSAVPQEIIVFVLGGVTYEEATKVHDFNQTNKDGVKVILSGSTIHNSTSFLEELREL